MIKIIPETTETIKIYDRADINPDYLIELTTELSSIQQSLNNVLFLLGASIPCE